MRSFYPEWGKTASAGGNQQPVCIKAKNASDPWPLRFLFVGILIIRGVNQTLHEIHKVSIWVRYNGCVILYVGSILAGFNSPLKTVNMKKTIYHILGSSVDTLYNCDAQNNGRTSVNFRSICAYDRATCTRAGHLVQPFL